MSLENQVNKRDGDKLEASEYSELVQAVIDVSKHVEENNVDVIVPPSMSGNEIATIKVGKKEVKLKAPLEPGSSFPVEQVMTPTGSAVPSSAAVLAQLENKADVSQVDEAKTIAIGALPKDSPSVAEVKDSSDILYIADADGNVVAKIGRIPNLANGIQAANYFDKEGNNIVTMLANALLAIAENEGSLQMLGEKVDGKMDANTDSELILGSNSDRFVITDKFGNVAAILGSDGILRSNFEFDTDVIKNDFVLPSRIYCMDGVQRNIWHQSLLARWNPYDYYLKFGGTASYQRRTPLVASIKSGNADGATVQVSLVDNTTMKEGLPKTSVLCVGMPNDASLSNIKVSFVGSSTVQLCYFKKALETYCSNYQLIGIRHGLHASSILHEGRGGASLASYFQLSTSPTGHYYPFWQPSGNYRYYGATGFWANAKTAPDSEAGSAYYYGCYNSDILDMFDESGWLINPSNGAIMYDTASSSFKVYNGASWVATSQSSYTWAFDYAKYLTMWSLDTPDVVCITLGANDFRNADMPLNLELWGQRMQTMIDSIHSVNPNAKIVICNQGPFGNHGYLGDPTALMNYKMWLHLQFIIETFDNRTNENIFVVAQGSEISSEYGFAKFSGGNALVSELYSGSEIMTVQSGDVVHPRLSLDNMGVPIASFIQYIRKI